VAAVPGCECGARVRCLDTWHEALAAEQGDPAMARWHNPLVCCFVLQHRSHFQPRFADGQYRFLQLLLDRGVDAVNAEARRRTARNRGSHPRFDARSMAGYEALPTEWFPPSFSASVNDLRDAQGGFVGDGHAAYGERIRNLTRATVDAWGRHRAT
jgi:Family of unknown function (DUF5946)